MGKCCRMGLHGYMRRYMLCHTPRQIVEERGRKFLREAYHIYVWRLGGDFDPEDGKVKIDGNSKLRMMAFDPTEYVDGIPDDSFFEAYHEEAYKNARWDMSVEELKLAFITICAVVYSSSPECWLNHLDKMTDEEITEKLNQRPERDRRTLDRFRETNPDWSDRELAEDILSEGSYDFFEYVQPDYWGCQDIPD